MIHTSYYYIHGIRCLFIFIVVSILISCDEKVEISGINGRLVGDVHLYDAGGTPQEVHGDVVIQMDNGLEVYETKSGMHGRFEFTDVPTGTYDISFMKEGYGTYRYYGYAFVGGQQTTALDEPIPLVAQSFIYLGNLEMQTSIAGEATYFSATAELLFNPQNLDFTGVRYFLSNSDNVSRASYLQSGTTGFNVSSDKLLINFPIQNKILLNSRKVYLIIHSCTSCDLFYTDIASGRKVYYTTNPRGSDIAEAIIP